MVHPIRSYHPRWVPRTRYLWKPTYYDNELRRFDSAAKTRRWNVRTGDPLFFDHAAEGVNGGIGVVSEIPLGVKLLTDLKLCIVGRAPARQAELQTASEEHVIPPLQHDVPQHLRSTCLLEVRGEL